MAASPIHPPNYGNGPTTLPLPRQRLSRSLTKLGMLTRQLALLNGSGDPCPREVTRASRAFWTCALEAEVSMSHVLQENPTGDVGVLAQAVELTVELAALVAGVDEPRSGPGGVLGA